MLTQKFTAFCSVCNQGTHIWVPQCTKECEIECHRLKFESPVEPKMKILSPQLNKRTKFWVPSWNKELKFESSVQPRTQIWVPTWAKQLKFESHIEPKDSVVESPVEPKNSNLSPALNQGLSCWVPSWTKELKFESPVDQVSKFA